VLPEQWLLYASFQYLPPSEKPLDIDALIVMDDHQRKPLAKSRSEIRPPLNVETARNSLSQWLTSATTVANRRK